MPTVYTEGKIQSDWIKRCYPDDLLYTNETVQLLAGNYVTGTVLGKVTATGLHKPLTPAATDGSQNVAGILWLDAELTADGRAAIIKRGQVVYVSDELTWPAGITAPQKATATAQLETMGFVARIAV
jgi:hypothetical protein